MVAEGAIGSFFAGQLHQLVVSCHGHWKLNIVEKDGPLVSCGRKVCWPLTSAGNCVCGEVAPSHRTVFWWTKCFNRKHETVKKGISPDCPPTACMSSAAQHVSHILMEDRHVTIDDLQLATSLCHATIHAIIHGLEDEEDFCTLSAKGSHAQTTGEKGAELARAAGSSQQGPRDILCQTGNW